MEKIGGTVRIKKIAITGRPAVGKSSALRLLASMGAYVIQSDKIVHSLYKTNKQCKKSIVEAFGKDIQKGDELNREKIAAIVFNEPEKLSQLEAIIHPIVEKHIKDSYKKLLESKDYIAFVCEHPLLFETNFDQWFDTTIYLTSQESTSQTRFAALGFSNEDYQMRSKRFLPVQEASTRADLVIQNDGSLEELKTHLLKVLPLRI